jgi:hypothetical protein
MTQDQRKAAATKLGLHDSNGNINISKQSLLGAVGGWLGIVESVLPALLFVSVLAVTKDTVASVITAVTASAIFLIIQIVRKKPLTQAIAGAVGIAISAFLPLREGGQPEDYFVQGFITNSVYLAVLLISVLLRWPIIGVLVGFLIGEGSSWRSDRGKSRRFQAATMVWIGLFAARLLVQLPLYFAHATEALGIARIAMGVPLYALCIWFTWLLVRGVLTPRG